LSYDKNNIFAKIIRGEIPCDKVYEDEHTLAFNDINPAAKVHILVIPKAEYTSFNDFAANASPEQIALFYKAVKNIAAQQGLDKTGYRLISNHGTDAYQTVEHFHVHILGGEKLAAMN